MKNRKCSAKCHFFEQRRIPFYEDIVFYCRYEGDSPGLNEEYVASLDEMRFGDRKCNHPEHPLSYGECVEDLKIAWSNFMSEISHTAIFQKLESLADWIFNRRN